MNHSMIIGYNNNLKEQLEYGDIAGMILEDIFNHVEDERLQKKGIIDRHQTDLRTGNNTIQS